jgi:hypothetical protein
MADTRIAHALVALMRGRGNASAARAIIAEPEAPPAALLAAAKILLGPTCMAWEPEVIWHEMKAAGAHDVHHDALLAACALSMTPSYWWDWRAFAATARAFSHQHFDYSGLEQVEPEILAASVAEADACLAISTTLDDLPVTEFDAEPEAYAAACLYAAAMPLAPDALSFAQDKLDRMNHAHARAIAAEAKKESPSTPEALVAKQRAKEINEFVESRKAHLADYLERITT